MLLDLTKLQTRKTDILEYNDLITLDESLYKDTDIIRLNPVNTNIVIKRVTDFSYDMHLKLTGVMVLPCSVTLKEVEYPFDIETDVKISNEDELDDECVRINQNSIDIIPIIWQNIVLEIPIKVVSEDAYDNEISGNGWKLIRED